jgi:hypothetical protein
MIAVAAVMMMRMVLLHEFSGIRIFALVAAVGEAP